MYKHLYRRFLEKHEGILHFAAHSHHFWPDATREAMVRYWDDSARMADRKWDHIFGSVIPEAQRNVADCLGLPEPDQIVFSTNTHEFVCRLFSCLPVGKPIRVLTTDGEFHSFRRQLQRLEEDSLTITEYIPVDPPETLSHRIADQLQNEHFDLFYLSHAFFNSGYVVTELERLVQLAAERETLIVVDAYHAFCALPVDYSAIGQHAFITAGGYKYAQAGEGACFLHVPPNCDLRPRNTGWYSAFGLLEAAQAGDTRYGHAGQRFAGATFDPSGVYRYNAAMQCLRDEGLTIADVHRHVNDLQLQFRARLDDMDHFSIRPGRLLYLPDREHAHFFTFQLASAEETSRLSDQLRAMDIITDHRGDRLRFGFGLYQDTSDVDELFDRLQRLR